MGQNEITYQQLIDELKSGQIGYDQIYNLDTEIAQFMAARYYIENPNDNINVDQKINLLLFDIEVYHGGKEIDKDKVGQIKSTSPISAITIYSTMEKTYHTYFLVLPKIANLITQDMIPELEKKAKELLVKQKYLDEDDNIKIHLFISNELGMMETCFRNWHRIDPAVISGWYSDEFDLPYIYNRLNLLYGNDRKTANLMSKFGCIKKRKIGGKLIINIGEYPLLDLQRMYKVRDEGGFLKRSTLNSSNSENILT